MPTQEHSNNQENILQSWNIINQSKSRQYFKDFGFKIENNPKTRNPLGENILYSDRKYDFSMTIRTGWKDRLFAGLIELIPYTRDECGSAAAAAPGVGGGSVGGGSGGVERILSLSVDNPRVIFDSTNSNEEPRPLSSSNWSELRFKSKFSIKSNKTPTGRNSSWFMRVSIYTIGDCMEISGPVMYESHPFDVHVRKTPINNTDQKNKSHHKKIKSDTPNPDSKTTESESKKINCDKKMINSDRKKSNRSEDINVDIKKSDSKKTKTKQTTNKESDQNPEIKKRKYKALKQADKYPGESKKVKTDTNQIINQ